MANQGRPTSKKMHPFIREVMESRGCANLNQLAKLVDISQQTLYGYAYENRLPRKGDERLAQIVGLSWAETVKRLLDDTKISKAS